MDACLKAANCSDKWQANFLTVLTDIQSVLDCLKTNSGKISPPQNKELTFPALFMIFVIFLFLSLCVISSIITLYEELHKRSAKRSKSLPAKYKRANSQNGVHQYQTIPEEDGGNTKYFKTGAILTQLRQFLDCFCFIKTGRELLKTDNASNRLSCLDGIRVIGLLLVVAVHFGITVVVVVGPEGLKINEEFLTKWYWQLFYNSIVLIDIFFLMSGFLNARNFFKDYTRSNGKINWIHHYRHRFLRLTPIYIIMLGIFTFLFPYAGSGPLWPSYSTNPVCQERSWLNVLYINNMVPQHSTCMLWTWSMAVDFQFYVLSPLIFLVLLRWRRVGYLLSSVIVGMNVFYLSFLKYKFDWMTDFTQIVTNTEVFLEKFPKYFDEFYVKTHTRTISYVTGIMLAYYLHKRKEEKPLTQMTINIGWLLTAFGFVYAFYGQFYANPSRAVAVAFFSMRHVVFTAALAWVIYVCVTGNGGMVNKFLSWRLFGPLSRICYCLYMVHAMILYYFVLKIEEQEPLNIPKTALNFALCMSILFPFSFVLTAVFEYPIQRLCSLVENRNKPRKEKRI